MTLLAALKNCQALCAITLTDTQDDGLGTLLLLREMLLNLNRLVECADHLERTAPLKAMLVKACEKVGDELGR